MRKLLTVLIAALLTSSGLMLTASPASAHHTTIRASVTCADNGAWLITWRVQNWNGGGTATVTSSSRGVVPVGTTIENNATKTFTERVTTAQSLGLTVGARWSNGSTANNSGSISKDAFPTDCAPAETPVTPAAPSVVDPTCDADGRLVVPASTDKVTYTQNPTGSGPGTYTIKATAKPGYKITGQGTWTITVKPRLTGSECLVPVTPVAPQAGPITKCGEYGSLRMLGTEGISYKIVEGDGKQGPWKVIATAQDGYVIADGATTEWSGDLGTYEECPTPVTPVAPQVIDITECGIFGDVQLPQTEGVDYTLVEGDGKQGSWKVTAIAKDGYVLADGATTEWSGDLGTYEECPTPVTPVAPQIIDLVQCETPGSITLPTTDGVLYEIVAGLTGQGQWSVVASVLDGFILADGAVTEWSGDFGQPRECDVKGEEEEKPEKESPADEKDESGPGTKPANTTQAGVAPRDGVLPNTGSSNAVIGAGILGALLTLGGLVLLRRRPVLS